MEKVAIQNMNIQLCNSFTLQNLIKANLFYCASQRESDRSILLRTLQVAITSKGLVKLLEDLDTVIKVLHHMHAVYSEKFSSI